MEKEFENVIFNEIQIRKDDGIFIISTTRWRVWDSDKNQYVPKKIEAAELPPEIGEALMKTLIETIKFQNKVITNAREFAHSMTQLCSYSSNGETINCKI